MSQVSAPHHPPDDEVSDDQDGHTHNKHDRDGRPTVKPPAKLPYQQLTVLAICRLADPIALSSVFPYLPEMMEYFDVPEASVSKWAGITSAIFSLSQAITGVLWGRASDRFGRKPVILCGMTSIMIASVLFGFSRSLTWAIVTRAMSGACNGNVGLMRTAVAELVPQKELQPAAFAVMPLVWQIGTAVGPVMGGLLAKPVEKYPTLFGGSRLLREYPFALPNLVAAVFFLFGLVSGFLFLKETLETKAHRRDVGRILGSRLTSACSCSRKRSKRHSHLDEEDEGERTSLLKHPPTSPKPTHPQSTSNETHVTPSKQSTTKAKIEWREIFTPQSNVNLIVYTLLALHSVAYDQLIPVFLHYPSLNSSSPSVLTAGSRTPIPFAFIGGLSLSSGRIGLVFAMYAGLGMIIQSLIFPRLTLRWGALHNLKVVSVLYPLVYILTPFIVYLPSSTHPSSISTTTASSSSSNAPEASPYQYAGTFLIMALKCYCSIFAFPCSTILLTNSASSLRILGTLNGIAVSISSLGRAAGPFLAGWCFTLGVEWDFGVLPWWTLAVCASAAAVPVWWLEEGKGFAERDQDKEDAGSRGPEREIDREAEREADSTLLPGEGSGHGNEAGSGSGRGSR